METSERAKAFLASLDEEALQVGDGTDGKPVWIGVDAEAGRVYKVYASGLAQGFGDGKMLIRCGLQTEGQWNVGEGIQVTAGRDVVLSNDDELRTFECEPGPTPAAPPPHPLMPFPLVMRSFKLPETGDHVHVSIGTPDDTWSVGMPGKTLFEAAGSLMRWADMVGGFGKLREQSVDNVRATGLRPVGNPNDAEISRMRWELSAGSTRGKSEPSEP